MTNDKDEVVQALRRDKEALRNENEALRNENEELKAKIEWRKVEELIQEWTEGTLTRTKNPNDPRDVITKNGTHLEVKYSKINNPTNRWNFYNILGRGKFGRGKKKEYDYLVLAGAKNQNHEYPDLPYVFFLVPRSVVENVMKGRGSSQLAFPTNLKANGKTFRLLESYQVKSQNDFELFKRPTSSVADSGT